MAEATVEGGVDTDSIAVEEGMVSVHALLCSCIYISLFSCPVVYTSRK